MSWCSAGKCRIGIRTCLWDTRTLASDKIGVLAVAVISLVEMWRVVLVVVMADSMVMVGFGSGMDANKIWL